jgi:hypothetical protein
VPYRADRLAYRVGGTGSRSGPDAELHGAAMISPR